MLEEKKGTVMILSSVSGFVSLPYMGGYCASKHSVNAFANSLRAELVII